MARVPYGKARGTARECKWMALIEATSQKGGDAGSGQLGEQPAMFYEKS